MLCAHCGLHVPDALVVKDRERQFCCSGCEAVYQLLHECNLEEYYRLRDAYLEDKASPAKISGKQFDYLDDPEYLKHFAKPQTAGGYKVEIFLENVHCIACSWLVEKVLLEREGARFARLDPVKSVLEVVFSPQEVKLSRLAQALDRIGYTPHPLGDDNSESFSRKEARRLIAQLGVAGACAGNIMLLAVVLYAGEFSGIEPEYANLFRWVSLGLVLPAVFFSAMPFYQGAIAGLKYRTLQLDLPISLGILAAFGVSLIATIQQRGEVYFDTVSALIFLLLVGRFVLHRAGRWAVSAGESLLSLAPKVCKRIEVDGIKEVPLTEILFGDCLSVVPGDQVPVDGTLNSDRAWIKETHLTGEPAAVLRLRSEMIYAGSTCEQSPFQIIATAVGETTRLAMLSDLMRNASTRKAKIITLANRAAGYFVGVMLSLSLMTGIIWYMIDPSRALWNAASLLIIACPCALGLATPVALSIAMGRAARRGLFIKGTDGVERISQVKHVILDKTGTLTEGKLSLVEQHYTALASAAEQQHLQKVVAAIERMSGHVVAAAFSQIDVKGVQVEDLRTLPGFGIEANVQGVYYLIGSEKLLTAQSITIPDSLSLSAKRASSQGHTVIYISRNRELVAVFALGDHLRSGAKQTITELISQGLSVELLSGDHPAAVEYIARELKITTFSGRVTPEEKLARIEFLENSGTKVAMVGDGINDAAALSRASVGISVAEAADIARDAADLFISSRGPLAIAEAFRISHHAMRIIRINLFIAIGYNLIGIALAMTGHITPLLAAILMPVSSITVLTIASRA